MPCAFISTFFSILSRVKDLEPLHVPYGGNGERLNGTDGLSFAPFLRMRVIGSMGMSQVVKGEMSAKTTYQRSAKGPVQISECSSEGKFCVIENTSNKVSFPAKLNHVGS